jgi:hypothetical protein
MVCMEMPTLNLPAFTLAMSAVLSCTVSTEAAFSPLGPCPTIDLGPIEPAGSPVTHCARAS